ncbi:MAG: hypothetical protein FWD18_00710 [Micrococcales bacterium]|nr:hypothetical protein [Micrococcales bacterium]
MKTARTRTLAAVGALTLAAGLLAGCGDSSSTAKFCEILEGDKYADLDPYENPDAALDAMRDLRAAAPSDIKGDIDVMIDAFQVIRDIPEDDITAQIEALGKLDLEKIEAASDAIEEKQDALCKS